MDVNPFGWKFAYAKPASALFFRSTHNAAIRLECPDINLEFTDGAYIGQDPAGYLHYNSKSDFEQDTNKQQNYFVRLEVAKNGKTYAVIRFRKHPSAKSYAKFCASDKHRVTTAAEMNGHAGTGTWVTLKTGHCYATIEKNSGSSTVTVTPSSIGKVATWNAGSTIFSPSSFKVIGQLWYKEITELKNAIYANYNNDRVVFYQNDYTGRDFVAFFIPDEDEEVDSPPTLGIESTKSTPAATFTNVQWTDIA
ncbi:hypothetical protein MSAN_00641200 [Mycena sanguinolenta]|uniref:Uncharacterized protein n=1 Tax=Mycena sanguinolenta TaxID=230812 RepID=A0A8H6Z4C4_9AGAR|nr:hypothetical protein MSAN_00641200 [Mycena sanguinolenta]